MMVATTLKDAVSTDDKCIVFENGLVGLPDAVRFTLQQDCEGSPFHWLQSLDDPSLTLAVIHPAEFFVDYAIELQDADLQVLNVDSADDVIVLTTITLDNNTRRVTTNLLGPIVINGKTLVGKQVVLANDHYATRHVLFECSESKKIRSESSHTRKTIRKTEAPLARAA